MSFRHLRNVRGFFSDYYLGSVFGRGSGRGRKRTLSDRDTDVAYSRFIRCRERAEGRAEDAAACREKFLRPFLRDVLGWHLGQGEGRIAPLFPSAEVEGQGAKPLILAYCGAWDEELDQGRGAANPRKMMETALARAGLRYGILATGERILLVRAAGEGPAGACLEVSLDALAEGDDPESFAAFLRLFHLQNFQPGEGGLAPIDTVEAESRQHAEKVSDDLKEAVFKAAEAMAAGLISDAIARGKISDPARLPESDLLAYRDAAFLAIYRILFILYAESRDTRLDQHEVYQKSYSASGLVEELLRNPDRDWPENSASLWARLRALFSIYDKGLPPITPWQNIPPRGGNFFNAETPTGKVLEDARLSDDTVAQVVANLAVTTPRRGVGRERISFRELDIEQLGAVYEGLLEYEPSVVASVALEVKVQGRSYALAPSEVVRLCKERKLLLAGNPVDAAGTEAEPLLAVREDEATDEEDPGDAGESSTEGEESDEDEEKVAKGGMAKLIRRLDPGTFHFVPGAARKGSGSFYTPLPLVRDLVRHTLGPLVEGKKAAQIERLRVLDPACGSAHFLVEAMRFLGQALHKAYAEEHAGKPPPEFRPTQEAGWDADWRSPDAEARSANSEARAWCKRRIAERCLFGVDLNPTAVELARVALWIESVAGDRPLTFFEHHVRCGNSLLGAWLGKIVKDAESIAWEGQGNLFVKEEQAAFFGKDTLRGVLGKAAEARRRIDAASPDALRREGIEPDSLKEQTFKEHQLREADEILKGAKLLFDLYSAVPFVPAIEGDFPRLSQMSGDAAALHREASSAPWWGDFEKVRDRERFFHWELEFPEVFLDEKRPGFDVILGNPPWDKVKPDKKEFYGRADILIRAYVGGDLDRRIKELHAERRGLADEFGGYERRVKTIAACLKKGGDYRFQDWEIDGRSTGGDPDLFKFFVERAWRVAREEGRVGFVAPSAIYNNEGCTGLRHLLLEEAQVERFYAFENRHKIFAIDSRYKFASLVFRKGKPEGDWFEAAFMRHDLGELERTSRFREAGARATPERAPWIVAVKRLELERLSPGTLAFLEYRSPRDREILLKMYGYDAKGNPMNPRPLLGEQGPGTWNARFYTEFHMTNDRDLWTDPKTGKLYNPRQILGKVAGTLEAAPFYDPAAFPEIRTRMAEKGFWPLYQDAHIHQYVLHFKPMMRWLRLESHQSKYGGQPANKPKLVLRDRGTNTHERMCVAAILREQSCFGHSLNGIDISADLMKGLTALINSLSFDFLARVKNSGLHVSPYILRFCATPSAEAVRRLPVIDHMEADGQKTWIYEKKQSWEQLWKVEEGVAKAYGLSPDDFEQILATFPGFARERPEFSTFLQVRLAEWKKEAGLPVRGRTAVAVSAGSAVQAGTPKTDTTKKSDGRARYNQAAVLAYVVHVLDRSDLGRVGHDKVLYFVQEYLGADLGLTFERKAAGPWDPALKHKVEPLAKKQGWLHIASGGPSDGTTALQPGQAVQAAVAQAQKKLGGKASRLREMCEFFNAQGFGTAGLERWATIHKCWRDLGGPRAAVSEDALVREVLAWKGNRPDYTEDAIRKAIRGMVASRLVTFSGAGADRK